MKDKPETLGLAHLIRVGGPIPPHAFEGLTFVSADILEGIAKGLLSAHEASLVAAVLFLSQTPGRYIGPIEDLTDALEIPGADPFKDVYAQLKKAQKNGLIEMLALEPEGLTGTPKIYEITVLPPSQWQT